MLTFIPVYEFTGSLTLTLDGKSHHLGPLREYNPATLPMRHYVRFSRKLCENCEDEATKIFASDPFWVFGLRSSVEGLSWSIAFEDMLA